MREYVLALLIAAATTYLLTPLVRRGAIATNSLHAARARDVHVNPTPLLGGLAMYGGLAAGLLVANQLSYLREAFPSSRTVPGLLLAGGCARGHRHHRRPVGDGRDQQAGRPGRGGRHSGLERD